MEGMVSVATLLGSTHDGSFCVDRPTGALCGNVVGVKGKFFASEHALIVTAKEGTNIRFLTYVLGRMRLNRFSESSAQPGLSVSKLLGLPLAIPPTEAEQRAIATALSDVDALLDGLARLIAKKRDLKQAALQQLLTGQTRLHGFHGEWQMKRLGDAVDTDPENLGPDTRDDFAFNYIALEDVERGILLRHSEQVFAKAPSRARRKLRPSDILVSTVRPICNRTSSSEVTMATGCAPQDSALCAVAKQLRILLSYSAKCSQMA